MRVRLSAWVGSLILVIALTSIMAATAFAGSPVTKSTGKDAAALTPAFSVFPGSDYDTPFTNGYSGASGKVNMIQPNGNVDVILAVSADGLKADTRYIVYFDTNGITAGTRSTAGSWVQKGEFWSDASGHGEWNYTAPAGTETIGVHTISVFINDAAAGGTMLISDNITFEVATAP